MANAFNKTVLAVVELRFLKQVRHTDNRVHRRSDFMAHVGKKFALGLGGLFCNFAGSNNFGNVDHRKHVTHNRVLNFKRASFTAEPSFCFRTQLFEHEGVFPDILLVKGFSQRIDDIFGHAALGQFIQRFSKNIIPLCHEVIRQLLGHVFNFALSVKYNENRIACRKHDGIENRIFLNAARFIGNNKQVANRSIVFNKELEYNFPPHFFARETSDRDDDLPFARVHFTTLRNSVDKLFELLGMEETPKNFAADIYAIVEEIRKVGASVENVKCIVGEDNSKVIAT